METDGLPPSEAEWAMDPWPGMLLRRNGRVTRVPLDRDLQAALDWAAKEYFDPSRPATRPLTDHLLAPKEPPRGRRRG